MSQSKGRWSQLSRFVWKAADRSVWVRLGAALAAACVASALAVAAPYLLKIMIDHAAAGRADRSLAWWAGLYVLALTISRLVEQAQNYLFGTGEQRLQQRLSGAMFSHVLRLPMSFHLERQTGGLVQMASQLIVRL